MGFNVVKAARIIPPENQLDNLHFTNHGGVALVSKPGLHTAKIASKMSPTTLEHFCCRIGAGFSQFLLQFLLVMIYRPGSESITDLFFTEFGLLLELLATLNCPIVLTGDLNIHLEWHQDADSLKLLQVTGAYGLRQLVQEPTHDRGGLLDVMLTTHKTDIVDVVASESGFSDHKVVHWTMSTAGPLRPMPKHLEESGPVSALTNLSPHSEPPSSENWSTQ